MSVKSGSRYEEANLIRTVSMMGIVIFHVFTTLDKYFNYKYRLFHLYPNGDCGSVFVAVFFILSGFLLYMKYSDRIDVLQFFKKRWLSIFPTFYLSWLIFYVVRVVVEKRTLLWGGPVRKILLTVLGVDGYFYYKGMNYYLVGEWFLGAIIFLYLVFPMLQKLFKNHPVVGSVGITMLWLWQINTTVFTVNSYRNLISCAVSFAIGIMYAKYYEAILDLQKNVYVVGIEVTFFIICRCFQISINANILMHVMGAVLYLILISMSMVTSKILALDKIVAWFASVSFGVYLVHHRIIYLVIPHVGTGNIHHDTIVALLICIPISILLGWGVTMASIKARKLLLSRYTHLNQTFCAK